MAVPGITSMLKSARWAAFKAGVKIAGVIISSTIDFTILPKAPPITTPTARSITLPFMANVLNSFMNPIFILF